jgi:hypothetical protein
MPLCEMMCLAVSRKHGGRCVAGVRTDGTGWMRPVGVGLDGKLLGPTCLFANGSEPRVLDTIQIGLRQPRPQPHQPENWIIDLSRWKLLSRPNPSDVLPRLLPHISHDPVLLGTRGDRVCFDSLKTAPAAASLALVEPDRLSWLIKYNQKGNRQTRAEFTIGGQPYCLSVTDPIWESRLCHLPPGTHPANRNGIAPDQRVFLTVSVGEPFGEDGYCYKFVAAVIVLPNCVR